MKRLVAPHCEMLSDTVVMTMGLAINDEILLCLFLNMGIT